MIQTLPYVPSERQPARSEDGPDGRAQTCTFTRAVVTSRFNVSVQILASRNLQDSQQDKRVCQDEMSRRNDSFSPPKLFNKIKQVHL